MSNEKLEQLLDAAFRILQHDTDESDPEWQWQRKTLREKFIQILKTDRAKEKNDPGSAKAKTH